MPEEAPPPPQEARPYPHFPTIAVEWHEILADDGQRVPPEDRVGHVLAGMMRVHKIDPEDAQRVQEAQKASAAAYKELGF